MIDPARASRKFRSTVKRRPKAAPPQMRMARSVTCSAVSAAAALLSSTASRVAGPGLLHQAGNALQKRCLNVHRDPHLRQPGTQVGQRRQRLAEVIQPSGQQVLPGRFGGGAGDAHGDGGGTDLEPRQHGVHHRGEALAVAAESVRRRHGDVLQPHRCTGVAAQTQARSTPRRA